MAEYRDARGKPVELNGQGLLLIMGAGGGPKHTALLRPHDAVRLGHVQHVGPAERTALAEYNQLTAAAAWNHSSIINIVAIVMADHPDLHAAFWRDLFD